MLDVEVEVFRCQITQIATLVVERITTSGDCGMQRVLAQEPALVSAKIDMVVVNLYDGIDLEKDRLSGRRVV